MNPARPSSRSITPLALTVELGLAGVAVGVGWLVGRWPLAPPAHALCGPLTPAQGALAGLAATLPMAIVLYLISHMPFGPLQRLNEFVRRQIVPLFAGTTVAQMAVISAAAGVGEEMLFRGLLQTALADLIGGSCGVVAALLIASVVFGVFHLMTPTYAVLATAIGLYLGGLFLLTGNLLAPIVSHALYDFLALVYLVKIKWKEPLADADVQDQGKQTK